MTREEIATVVDEAHRMGYRVAAHAEGLDGTQIAIETGIDTIEHGMYLNQRPDLLERMAATGQVLVPTLRAASTAWPATPPRITTGDGAPAPGGERPPTWAHALVDLALHNLEQADLHAEGRARRRASRSPRATTGRRSPTSASRSCAWSTTGSMPARRSSAATSTAARALGLGDAVGTIAPGRLADLLVVDGDPLARPALLRDPDRIWLVLQLGAPVAGTALERDPAAAQTTGGGVPAALAASSGSQSHTAHA